jgi:hypothetical protein
MKPRIPFIRNIQVLIRCFRVLPGLWALSLLAILPAAPCNGQTLGVALDQTNLVWTTTARGIGTAGVWYGQTAVSQDGVSAATPPIITSQPPSQSQVPGLSSTFSVSAGGTPPLYWQWHFDGDDIPGATASALTITNVGLADLGSYSVTVSNAVGSLVSSNASLEFGQVTSWGLSASGATATAPGASNIQAIATGSYFTLALRTDGSILGWGYDGQGQITKAGQLTNIMALAAKVNCCLALKRDGTVIAWGGDTNVPAGLTNVIGIAAGWFHALALTGDGHVVAWGLNYNGQTNVPAGLSNVVAVAAGATDSLALKADGTVIGWGSNTAPPSTLSNAVAVAEGAGFCLALTEDGKVTAWGGGTLPQQTIPPNLGGLVAISAGDNHGMALREDGTVVAWGYVTAALTNIPAGLMNVVSISAGSFHNVALTAASAPKTLIDDAQLLTTGFSISLPSQCGRVYGLEYKNAIDELSWTRLPLVAGTGETLLLSDSSAAAGARFYRIRRW